MLSIETGLHSISSDVKLKKITWNLRFELDAAKYFRQGVSIKKGELPKKKPYNRNKTHIENGQIFIGMKLSIWCDESVIHDSTQWNKKDENGENILCSTK